MIALSQQYLGIYECQDERPSKVDQDENCYDCNEGPLGVKDKVCVHIGFTHHVNAKDVCSYEKFVNKHDAIVSSEWERIHVKNVYLP